MRNFPKEYAFVYIQKIGLPYYANIDQFQLSSTFTNRNNVDDRARVASRVLNYLIKKVYPKTRTVAVLGHSEGSDVVVRLARWNKNVTHICFASGSGNNVWMDYASLTRRRMFEGKISAESAQQRIDTLWQGMQLVKTDPYSTTKYFHGDTYRWWTAINTPSLEYLKAIQIPIFLTIGSHDEKVPVEGSDLIVSEFRRLGKTNLTYKIYPRANHSFVEMKPNGDRTDHFLEMFLDFAAFVKTYQVKK
jgi:pimeloyl-ACP methyl ester carboxylesterase